MTNGRIYLIDNKGICHISRQIPYDMYVEQDHGNGIKVIEAFLLGRLKNKTDLKHLMNVLMNTSVEGKSTADDEECGILRNHEASAGLRIDAEMDDYSYVLNCSSEAVTILAKDMSFVLRKDELLVLNFDQEYERYKRTKGKRRIVLTDSEIYLCINSLDFYSRMYIGQYDHIDSSMLWKIKDYKQFRKDELTRQKLYEAIKTRVFAETDIPQLGYYASLGIWNERTHDNAKVAYDLQQVMRYRAAYTRKPEGDITVDFNTPIIEGSQPEIRCECCLEDDTLTETIWVNAFQQEILADALKNYLLALQFRIRELFSYYTKDSINLDIAWLAQRLYKGIPRSDEDIRKISDLHRKIVFSDSVE